MPELKVNPTEFQEKHARRLKAALEDIRRGVGKVTEAPGAKAAAKEAKMKARLVAKIDDGTWRSRVAAVELGTWKDKMVNKGVPRISGGIDAAREKVIDFASQLLPYISDAVTAIERMPDLTLEDSISRMNEFIRKMAAFKKK